MRLLCLLLLSTTAWAGSLDRHEPSAVRDAVARQLAPSGLPGWHSTPQVEMAYGRANVVRAADPRFDLIRIPTVVFQNTPLREALDWLKREARTRGVLPPMAKPLDPHLLNLDEVLPRTGTEPQVTLRLEGVTLREAYQRTLKAAKLMAQIQDRLIFLVPE